MTAVGPLRWGVIGLGNIVSSTIAPAMVAEDNCDLIAAVSRDQGRADAFAARYGVGYAYSDYRAMLENDDVEAVYIATPNALHAEQVIAAAQHGKHVLCDKPLATNVEDARRAVEACAAAGVELGMTFHYRYLPWVRDASRMIAEGLMGDVKVVELHVGSGPRQYDNWRADPALAGLGSVHNVGTHGLDLLRVLLHSDPVEVMAMFDPSPGSGSVEMLALVVLRFDNGALAYLNCNETLANPRNDITIYGSSGRMVGSGLTRARSDGRLAVLVDGRESVTPYPAPEAHRSCVAAFARAVLGHETPSPSGLDGLESALVCEAIGRSATERRVVPVDRARLSAM